jgi:hypothetical protein
MSRTTEACVNPTLLTRGAGERQPEPLSQSAEGHHATNRASPHPSHTPGVGETGPSMHWSNDQGMPMGMDANASSSQFMHTSAHEEIARFLLEDYFSPPAGSHPRPTTSNPHHSIRDHSIAAVKVSQPESATRVRLMLVRKP